MRMKMKVGYAEDVVGSWHGDGIVVSVVMPIIVFIVIVVEEEVAEFKSLDQFYRDARY